MESKTLNNLKRNQTFKEDDYDEGYEYCKNDVKQEAIKWIKEFQKERTDAISEMFDNPDEYGIYPTTKFFNRIDNFWMKRLNVKEEDLK